MPRVLAFDINRECTGVAYDGPDGRPRFSKIELPQDDFGIYGRLGARFEQQVCDLIEMHQPDEIGYEAALPPAKARDSAHTAHILIGLIFLLETIAFRYGIKPWPVNNQTAKKQMTGTGHADKLMVMKACKMLGWEPHNYDQADAAAVWAVRKAKDPKWQPKGTPLFARSA